MKRFMLLSVVLLLSMLTRAQVKVGDILCAHDADTSIVHPEDYASGAIGVVFFVDESGEHGWAIHPEIQANGMYWSSECELPWGLTGWTSIRDALYDIDGYDNTGFLRAASQYDHSLYPGAWAVDYEHGWYWPAAGQVNLLYGQVPVVNTSLEIIGGTLFQGSWVYWTSSQYGFDNDCAIYCRVSGAMGAIVKSRTELSGEPLLIRSVRNF